MTISIDMRMVDLKEAVAEYEKISSVYFKKPQSDVWQPLSQFGNKYGGFGATTLNRLFTEPYEFYIGILYGGQPLFRGVDVFDLTSEIKHSLALYTPSISNSYGYTQFRWDDNNGNHPIWLEKGLVYTDHNRAKQVGLYLISKLAFE